MVINRLLLRHVKSAYIMPNGLVHPHAYKPRERQETVTGYEKNVSISLKSCYPSIEDLEKHKNKLNRCVLFEINSDSPNSRGYPCIQDSECHVGITGDMAKLANDRATLEYLAVNSFRLYP